MTQRVLLALDVWSDDEMADGRCAPNPSYDAEQKAVSMPQKGIWQSKREGFGGRLEFVLSLKSSLTPKHPETGLHYNYFRDYDPVTGRYVESDPIGLEGGVNTYGYVLNNPLAYTDPTGELVPVVIVGARLAWGGYQLWRAHRAAQALAQAHRAAQMLAPAAAAALAVPGDESRSEIGRSTEADQQCEEDDFCKRLNEQVQAAKVKTRSLGSCRVGMTRAALSSRYSAWLDEATSRARRDQRCWSGGDHGHQVAQSQAWSNVGNCARLMGK